MKSKNLEIWQGISIKNVSPKETKTPPVQEKAN